MQLKHTKKICAVYEEYAVTDGRCQKWFTKFCSRDFSLDDAPQLGRPVELDSNQIETLIENNQHYTTREIANILKISKSIELFVKMKNVSFVLWKKLNGLFWPTQYIPLMWLFSVECQISGLTSHKMRVTIMAAPYLVCAKVCTNYFTCIIPLNLHYNPKRLVVLPLSYKRGFHLLLSKHFFLIVLEVPLNASQCYLN